MGMDPKDFKKLENNVEKTKKKKRKYKKRGPRKNPCAGCGKDIKTAVVTCLFVKGRFCVYCIKNAIYKN